MSDVATLTVPDGAESSDAVVVHWTVAAGDRVRKDQPIVELAIDKGDLELAAPVDGTVEELAVPAGSTVSAGQVLASIRTRPATTAPDVPGDDRSHVERLPPIRRRIAETMMRSLATTAQLTSVVPVDVTAMMALREEVKGQVRQEHGISLSPLAFLARASCMALLRHPVLNAAMSADGMSATFHDFVNLGMAVDTPRGLVVVSLKDAHHLSVVGLARAIGTLATRARDGDLTPDDVRGATFTITNTGSNGTLLGTPILNPPQSAILGTYAIQRVPRALPDGYGNDAIVPRSVMNLALTYDHRLIDGADAGRFLQDVRWVVEHHDMRAEL